MEPLIGAITGLATATVGLGAVLWRLHSSNHRQNGSTETIIALLKLEAEERREFRKEMVATHRNIAESLSYLKGRLG